MCSAWSADEVLVGVVDAHHGAVHGERGQVVHGLSPRTVLARVS
jgi:hypothetical protein